MLFCGLSGLYLGAAPAAGGRAAGHLPRALVAEIGDLRAASGIRIRDPQHRALRLVDLPAAVVANQDCFPSQIRLLNRFWNLILIGIRSSMD